MFNIKAEVEKHYDKIVAHRRKIHACPELSFKEYKTSEYIKSVLDNLGIEHKSFVKTGITATIGTSGKCIGIRADMDALPIEEETGLAFSSENKGVMHACGHDMHTAMLLGAAKIFKAHESELGGQIKLIFQPGEESLPGGAKLMIDEGALNDPKPDVIIAQHINPELEVGTIGLKAGPIMASCDEFYLTIKAKGSHAAQPHLGTDAILSAAQIIIYIQTIMTKFRNPLDPGVITVASVHGGSAPNIYPEEVKLCGTIRTFSSELRTTIKETLKSKLPEICSLYNTECDLRLDEGYPPVINSRSVAATLFQSAAKLVGDDKVFDVEAKMWAEDFSYFSETVPSVFWFTGVRPKETASMPALHNPRLSPEEDALKIGVKMMVQSALDLLNKE